MSAMTPSDIPDTLILVVDDFDDIRFSLRRLLEMRGYGVVEARDGREAVSVAIAKRPDLILMDLFMPRQDGFAAAREIKQDEGLRDVPIIAVSAYGELGIEGRLQHDAHAAGFTEYVAKPFDSDELLELIARLLGQTNSPPL